MVDHFVEMFQELYDDVDGLSSSRHNGSSKKKWGNKKRERAIGHAKLKRAYFNPPPPRGILMIDSKEGFISIDHCSPIL